MAWKARPLLLGRLDPFLDLTVSLAVDIIKYIISRARAFKSWSFPCCHVLVLNTS